jgi:hypothetical protein
MLQDYWEIDERNEELRETWRHIVDSPKGELALEMKPVVIAVNSIEQIEIRAG